MSFWSKKPVGDVSSPRAAQVEHTRPRPPPSPELTRLQTALARLQKAEGDNLELSYSHFRDAGPGIALESQSPRPFDAKEVVGMLAEPGQTEVWITRKAHPKQSWNEGKQAGFVAGVMAAWSEGVHGRPVGRVSGKVDGNQPFEKKAEILAQRIENYLAGKPQD